MKLTTLLLSALAATGLATRLAGQTSSIKNDHHPLQHLDNSTLYYLVDYVNKLSAVRDIFLETTANIAKITEHLEALEGELLDPNLTKGNRCVTEAYMAKSQPEFLRYLKRNDLLDKYLAAHTCSSDKDQENKLTHRDEEAAHRADINRDRLIKHIEKLREEQRLWMEQWRKLGKSLGFEKGGRGGDQEGHN